MSRFSCGHASHPDWRMATELALSQVGREGESGQAPLLGLVYASAEFAGHFDDIQELLERRLPQVQWSGACVPGVCADAAEYHREPAVAILLGHLPAGSVQAFGAAWDDTRGVAERLAAPGANLLLHADPRASDLAQRIRGLSEAAAPGLVFGGVVEPTGTPGRSGARAVSGVCFAPEVALLSRITHGCSPIGRERVASDCRGQAILSLDDRPALDVMLEDLGISVRERSSNDPQYLLRLLRETPSARGLQVGIAARDRPRQIGFGAHRIADLVGIDPVSRAIAVTAEPQSGDRAVFCRRDAAAARADLIRICTELREDLEASGLTARGAHYVSCTARGEHLFGDSGAELALIRHNLGDIPLAGFFANGEIANGRLHGYTGVLTLFV
jgi:small ligand-binding sensory domain FIST